MFHSGQLLDGRVTTLEAQAKIPLISANEMDNVSHDQLVARLRAIPEYGQQCQQVFGGPVTIECVSKAIAAFERTLLSGNSPYDRFAAGDSHALTEAANRGLALFRGKGRCSGCHIINEPFQFFTDRTYRNTGVSARNPAFETLARRARELARLPNASALNLLARQEGASELGRFLITGNSLDIGAFKIPSLRDVELTAPYFHDGSAQTLADVVRFYAGSGADSPHRDWELQGIVLTEPEQADVVEFLKSLTSDDTRRFCRRGLAHCNICARRQARTEDWTFLNDGSS
jgi:cytochrome c peroxidase